MWKVDVVLCYNCVESGHISSNCRFNSASECHTCYRFGHILSGTEVHSTHQNSVNPSQEDLPQKRTDLEIIGITEGRIECLAIEFRLSNEKWIVLSVYKEPKTKDAIFLLNIENLLYKSFTEECNMIESGDVNVDMLKSNCLQDVSEIQGCKNTVTKPTCFKLINNTLIDIVLTKLMYINVLKMSSAFLTSQ